VIVLVDSNVLLDIFTEDATWLSWSSGKVAEHAENDVLAINPIIYAEVSPRFSQIEELDDALSDFSRLALPWEAGFLAGRCFLQYRQRGGARRSPLPDFYIGAHASVSGLTLLTRAPVRYRTYFPRLSLISPQPD
jgi:predicted nucleic acid-binding protein